MSETDTKYFDLLTRGLGYLNRVEAVIPDESMPFLTVAL
ncbi:MAG: DUF3577 domain-containing protein, partial [Acidobacteria bacterium]|nr:DUF3577 domain-containing protein [Acidobacteriota bacterium]